MDTEITLILRDIARRLSIEQPIHLEYPENPDFGDYSSNIALIGAKSLKTNPKELAQKIVEEIKKNMPLSVERVEIAGPGFINFKLKDRVFIANIFDVLKNSQDCGKGSKDKGKRIIVEYTDPNLFKVFHIGHLMSNAIGESLARLAEYSGASVVRICYPSDIGLHIAKAVWAMDKHRSEIPSDDADIQAKTDFLGKMYVEGTEVYEKSKEDQDDIDAINEILYAGGHSTVMELYKKGKNWSTEHFEILYNRLGTKFDNYIYESQVATKGLDIVKSFQKKGGFEESQGAVIFPGEKYGLHTRVFVNARGLPTYETKEVGLNVTKFELYPDTQESLIVTASEQNDYFKVLIKALCLIDKNIGSKTIHVGHGMMRFSHGKMYSRTGNVVTAESLLADIKNMVKEKIVDRGFSPEEFEDISDIIAIGALKYTVLRQSIGSDIVFDSVSSISFEGDSGPYLQYSAVRAASILEKAKEENIHLPKSFSDISLPQIGILERLLARFPEIVTRARAEYSPQHMANYLINLAGAFNSFYATQIILDKNDPLSPYRLALTKAFLATITNGLWILGIKVPRRM